MVVEEVKIVEFAVVEFGVEDFTNEFIDVLDLAEDVFLKHAEAVGSVEDLEGSHSPQQLHRLVR